MSILALLFPLLLALVFTLALGRPTAFFERKMMEE